MTPTRRDFGGKRGGEWKIENSFGDNSSITAQHAPLVEINRRQSTDTVSKFFWPPDKASQTAKTQQNLVRITSCGAHAYQVRVFDDFLIVARTNLPLYPLDCDKNKCTNFPWKDKLNYETEGNLVNLTYIDFLTF